MFGIKNNETQILQQSSIFASIHISIERPINRFSDQPININ